MSRRSVFDSAAGSDEPSKIRANMSSKLSPPDAAFAGFGGVGDGVCEAAGPDRTGVTTAPCDLLPDIKSSNETPLAEAVPNPAMIDACASDNALSPVMFVREDAICCSVSAMWIFALRILPMPSPGMITSTSRPYLMHKPKRSSESSEDGAMSLARVPSVDHIHSLSRALLSVTTSARVWKYTCHTIFPKIINRLFYQSATSNGVLTACLVQRSPKAKRDSLCTWHLAPVTWQISNAKQGQIGKVEIPTVPFFVFACGQLATVVILS